jgi:hypothetical protein
MRIKFGKYYITKNRIHPEINNFKSFPVSGEYFKEEGNTLIGGGGGY